MTQVLIEKAKNLISKLSLTELKEFAKTAPDEILSPVLDELENRMPESEFIALCATL